MDGITINELSILQALAYGQTESGRNLRRTLNGRDGLSDLVAFYAMMAKMEDKQLVVHFDVDKVVAGQTIKERQYKITEEGRKRLFQLQIP